MRVYFKTFGCRLNRAESLDEEARYLADGWTSVESPAMADLIVVRCCSVTGRAEQESRKFLEKMRREHPLAHILPSGCLPQAIKAKYYRPLPDAYVPAFPGTDPSIPVRTSRAYLKVQDGCNGRCTFCAIPKFRGKSVSTDFSQCLERAGRFIEAGYHEIVVTGCNLSLYSSGGKHLCDLIGALADLDRNCRIRIGSLEPGICDSETLHAMASRKNICRSLHIPVQSGSDRILLAMRRPYLSRDITRMVDTAIRLMSDIAIGCDLITGFPGETDLDFIATRSLLERLPFSNAHIFPYSERPGTAAATFSGSVSKHLRSARAHMLQHQATENRRRFARRFIGRTVEVIIEDEPKSAGWTSQYLWFESSNAEKSAARKSLARFKVLKSENGILKGIPL